MDNSHTPASCPPRPVDSLIWMFAHRPALHDRLKIAGRFRVPVDEMFTVPQDGTEGRHRAADEPWRRHCGRVVRVPTALRAPLRG